VRRGNRGTVTRALVRAWLVIALAGACMAALAQEKHKEKGGDFEDAVISERVSSALGADSTLKHMRIEVATRDGVVHLRGFVDSMAQIERAAALARGVEGVSSVRNALRVAIRPSRA
jgi:osmotically-inducible protein OsmY